MKNEKKYTELLMEFEWYRFSKCNQQYWRGIGAMVDTCNDEAEADSVSELTEVMDLRGSMRAATCLETLVHSTHCVQNWQSFSHHQKLSENQYPFWNTWSQRPQRKVLTVLEIARLSKDKKANVFVQTQKKSFCVFYWKNEGMEESCQRCDMGYEIITADTYF